MIKNKHRMLSYIFGATFILSLVLIAFASLELINNYRENKELNALMERIEEDFNEDPKEEGYYINIKQDISLDIEIGKKVISFPDIFA